MPKKSRNDQEATIASSVMNFRTKISLFDDLKQQTSFEDKTINKN
jgi:hypothetical protein